MIRIIKGSYGLRKGSIVVPVLAGSDPIELSKEKEERLVRLKVAEYVTDEEKMTDAGTGEGTQNEGEIVDELPEYNADMKLTDLKKIAEAYGVDASSMRTKKDVIEAIDAAREELPAIDADALVE